MTLMYERAPRYSVAKYQYSADEREARFARCNVRADGECGASSSEQGGYGPQFDRPAFGVRARCTAH
jgi:hypothetical protein